jgi:hypothetical protein
MSAVTVDETGVPPSAGISSAMTGFPQNAVDARGR